MQRVWNITQSMCRVNDASQCEVHTVEVEQEIFYFANLTGCMYLNRHSGAIIIYEQVVQCNV